ncbi:MAG: TSUP family transporter [Phycisphaerales bacterium]
MTEVASCLLVCSVALVVAGLTFFSGFGLGTLLMPAFAAFFPLPVAVAATAVVHLANSLFKLALVGRHAHWPTVLAYGIPASVGAILGAIALEAVAHIEPIATYPIAGRTAEVTAIKLVVGVVIAAFAVLELWPGFERVAFSRRLLWIGGLVSGFFGGLSGHQGALRSAFLLRAGLTKEALIGTRVVGAVIVDVSRLLVYGIAIGAAELHTLRQGGGIGLVIAATLAAFVGTFAGSRLIKSITLPALRRFIGTALLVLAAALIAGWI